MQTSILTRVLLENDLDEQSAVEGVYSSSWIHVGRGEVRSAIAAELCELTLKKIAATGLVCSSQFSSWEHQIL